MEKISIYIGCIFISISFVTTATADYCAASGGGDEYISDFHFGTVHTKNTQYYPGGYDNRINWVTKVRRSASYQILVVNGKNYTGDQCRVWIDWNKDMVFGTGSEEIFLSNSGYKYFFTTITVPANAPLGLTRLRVRINYSGTMPPCGSTTYGEVEDYSIDITEADATEIIFESATMGAMNQLSGISFDEANYIGARFQLTEPTQITTVGAHIVHDPQSGVNSIVDYFIVELSGPSGFPNYNIFPAWGSTNFFPPELSMDFRATINMPVLQPGWYAIVIRYYDGYPGSGIMPTSGQSSSDPTTYMRRTSSGWMNMYLFDPPRFVLEGNIIAQCGEPNTPINPVPWNGIAGVDPNVCLKWSEQNSWPCATSYDVYLDKNNPPTTLVGENLAVKNLSVGMLDSNAVYYWKVAAKTDSGQKVSPVWTFTTESDSEPITLPRYRIIDLGVIEQIYWEGLPAGSSEAYAINEDGDVVGVSTAGGYQSSRAFYWHDANENDMADVNEMMRLEQLYTKGLTYGSDISNNGLAVGYYSELRKNSAFVWRDTDHDTIVDYVETTKLPIPSGKDETIAFGCNNNYKVVGSCKTITETDTTACLWDALSGTYKMLGAFSGTYSSARAINDAGIVVGSAEIADGNNHAFIWVDGNKDGNWTSSEMVDLGTFGGRNSYSYSVNNKGNVAGSANDSNQQSRAFLWIDENTNGSFDSGEMLRLDTSAGYASKASSVNNRGQVVGEGYRYPSNSLSRYGFYWDKDNGMVELEKLVVNRGDWIAIITGNYINDKGWIVGAARRLTGQNHAVLLIPEYSPADLNCDKKVNLQDLTILARQWQLEPDTADFYPGGGDGIVNLYEFAKISFAYETDYPLWPYEFRADLYYDKRIDIKDIGEFTKKYLKFNSTTADIESGIDDERVDFADFAIFAQNWLEGF